MTDAEVHEIFTAEAGSEIDGYPVTPMFEDGAFILLDGALGCDGKHGVSVVIDANAKTREAIAGIAVDLRKRIASGRGEVVMAMPCSIAEFDAKFPPSKGCSQ